MKNITARATTPRSVILIASPDAQLRARWRRILRGRFLAYEAGDKRELDHALTNLKPAVLLLDLALHRLGGVRGLASIQPITPVTKIIVFSNAPRITEELSALKLGAKGYSKRDISPALLKKSSDRYSARRSLDREKDYIQPARRSSGCEKRPAACCQRGTEECHRSAYGAQERDRANDQ